MSRFRRAIILGIGASFFFVLGILSSNLSSLPRLSYLTCLSNPTKVKNPPRETVLSSIPTSGDNLVKVTRVIDGDTIELEGGKRLRYIGMDTAELGSSKSKTECFAQEAYEKNKELVEGKEVGLEKDISETDKYGRLLRYVWIGDLMINEYLVRQGYASVSTYPPDVKYVEKFKEAEKFARENNLGLWSKCN
jgi:micrococcal nuclease